MLITWDDVITRYGDIARNGDAVAISSHYLLYAENELNSRLAPYYTTPFSSNNITAIDLAIDLAYYRLARPSENALKVYEDAEMRIGRLIKGEEAMIDSSGETLGYVADTIWSSTQDYHPTFGMGDIEYFAVSSQQVMDEEDARE